MSAPEVPDVAGSRVCAGDVTLARTALPARVMHGDDCKELARQQAGKCKATKDGLHLASPVEGFSDAACSPAGDADRIMESRPRIKSRYPARRIGIPIELDKAKEQFETGSARWDGTGSNDGCADEFRNCHRAAPCHGWLSRKRGRRLGHAVVGGMGKFPDDPEF